MKNGTLSIHVVAIYWTVCLSDKRLCVAHQRSYSTPSRVSTKMGERLRELSQLQRTTGFDRPSMCTRTEYWRWFWRSSTF